MKKSFIIIILLVSLISSLQAKKKDKNKYNIKINTFLHAGPINVHLPVFNELGDIENKKYMLGDLLKENQIKITTLKAEDNKAFDKNINWTKISSNKKGYIICTEDNKINYYSTYISTKYWLKANISIKTKGLIEVYLNGEKILSNYTKLDKEKNLSKEIQLIRGKHNLVIKTLGKLNITSELSVDNKEELSALSTSISPAHFLNINNTLDGKKISYTKISDDGQYLLLSYSKTLAPSDEKEYWSEIIRLSDKKIVKSFRGSKLYAIKFVPNSRKVSYLLKQDTGSRLYIFDLENRTESKATNSIEKLSRYTWAPNGEYIIYSVSKDYEKPWKLRKFQGMEDRLPGFRNRSSLYMLNIDSGIKQRLTYGNLSCSLNDISPDSEHIIFSQSRPDYTEYPFHKQNMYQLNVNTFDLTPVWKDKLFSAYVTYSPDGKNLLAQGGASAFGTIGENIGKQTVVNNYDGQVYIYNIASKNVKAITYNFNPSVKSAHWSKADGNIYMKAQDKDYVRIFRYNTKDKTIKALDLKADMIRYTSFAKNTELLAYTSCSISSPYKASIINLQNLQVREISNPEADIMKDVVFGKTKDWSFTSKAGQKIIGRIYYPPNFNKDKKYPLIVNYYGGTSPVGRSFGGRYPLNYYAAMGYVVYLLQPSGATGFGQEFSAKHQNNWGIITADEIIEGTKEFTAQHKFINKDKIGCIGASYGGFTTMLLQTRTDIFSAAISHAGISDITSYWGEGNWGYSYSTNASGHSYPWNNRKLYVDQSPLFAADKVTTPILLLHGSVDTNVPLGESIQMYQALKLLNKEVDFVQIKDQNHHIINYTKRIMWSNTIMAYFAKHLKDKKQWWDNMYPDKNL